MAKELIFLASSTMYSNRAISIQQVKNTTSKQFIFKKLCELNIGFIENIVEIPQHNTTYKNIVVYLRWNNTDKSKHILHNISEGKVMKLIYEIGLPHWRMEGFHSKRMEGFQSKTASNFFTALCTEDSWRK